MAVAAAGHRTERQLHLVAVAISIRVAREECRPSCGVFLLSQGYIEDTGVSRRDLLEEKVAVGSAELVEDDRSLGPDRVLDAPRVPPDVVAHRAGGSLRR